jgi:hypothetical protein
MTLREANADLLADIAPIVMEFESQRGRHPPTALFRPVEHSTPPSASLTSSPLFPSAASGRTGYLLTSSGRYPTRRHFGTSFAVAWKWWSRGKRSPARPPSLEARVATVFSDPGSPWGSDGG